MKIGTPFLFLLAIIGENRVCAQEIFTDLEAVQFGDSILVNWTLVGGSSCVDMELQRSTDGITFSEIFQVPGLCGASGNLYYSYIDVEMLQTGSPYFYRVTASGGVFLSDTVSVLFINAGEAGIFAYPNPSADFFNVVIDNSYNPPFLLEIFGADGKQLYQAHLLTAHSFLLEKGPLEDGMYVVKIITSDQVVLTSSIIISRD